MMKATVEVGDRLRNIRRERDLRQKNLADILGCEQTYVSGLETGRSFFTGRIIFKIAKTLGVRISDLDPEFFFFQKEQGLIRLGMLFSEKLPALIDSADQRNMDQIKMILAELKVALDQIEPCFLPASIEEKTT